MNGHDFGRREFLMLSAAGALATATVGPQLLADGRRRAVSPGAPTPASLAVGFATFGEGTRVVPASSVPAADGGFISRGARVSVAGASGTTADPRDRRVVELFTHFAYFEGAERRTAPFRAWTCSRSTPCQGSRLNYVVPVDETQRLDFSLSVERGAPAGQLSRRDAITADATENADVALSLSLTSEAGTLKLARGYYVVVPRFPGEPEPDWSRYSIGEREGRWMMQDADGSVADFEHIVLRIDYASA